MKAKKERIIEFIKTNWFKLSIILLLMTIVFQLFYIISNFEDIFKSMDNSIYTINDNVRNIEWRTGR